MSETAQGDTPKTACSNCVCGGAGPVLTEFLKRLGPPDGARRHFEQARVEILKGLRELIDARIDSLSSKPETKGEKVTVE